MRSGCARILTSSRCITTSRKRNSEVRFQNGRRVASPFLFMDELIRDGDAAIRLMRDDTADYQCMARWLTDVRVLEFYEGRDNPFPLARVMEEYAPRILLAEENTPCFLLYRETPIGYMQYYPVADSGIANLCGMDQFIGESCGTMASVHEPYRSYSYLCRVRGANAVMVDPHVDNVRAFRPCPPRVYCSRLRRPRRTYRCHPFAAKGVESPPSVITNENDGAG